MRVFNWIRSLFRRQSDPFDVYSPQERLIYTFWNGKERIKADPIVLYKRVMARGPELSVHIKVSVSPSKNAVTAHENMLEIIRGVFLIPKPAGGSPLSCEDTLTEVELLTLFDHFMLYAERLKKKSNLFVTSSSNTADSAPTSPERPPTPSTAGSGSTGNGQPTDGPMPSPTERASPSA